MEYNVNFGWQDFQNVVQHLIREASWEKEEVIFLLAKTIEQAKQTNFLIKAVLPVPQDALLLQTSHDVLVDPSFTIYVIKSCQRLNLSLMLAHAHLPQTDQLLCYSRGDDKAEKKIFTVVRRRLPHRDHGSILFNNQYLIARIWSKNKIEPIPVNAIRIKKSNNSVFDLPNIDSKFEYRSILTKVIYKETDNLQKYS